LEEVALPHNCNNAGITLKISRDSYRVDFNAPPIHQDETGCFYNALRNGETPCVIKRFFRPPPKNYEFKGELRRVGKTFYRFYESLEIAQTKFNPDLKDAKAQGYKVLSANSKNRYVFRPGDHNEGKGGFGEVRIGYCVGRTGELGKKMVVKTLAEKGKPALRSADIEARSLRRNGFSAERIEDKDDKTIYIVMDFAAGEQLSIRKFLKDVDYSFVEVIKAVCQLCQRLAHSHGKDRVHSDIKPQNIHIEVENKKLKSANIVDFGCAIPMENGSTSLAQAKGATRIFAAPEIKERQEVGFASDIYSMGLIFRMMFFNGLLWSNVPTLFRSAITSLLDRMVDPDYGKRPTVEQVSKFFMVLHRYGQQSRAARAEDFETLECLANPEEFLKRKRLPILLENQLELFVYASEHNGHDKKLCELANAVLSDGGDEQKKRVSSRLMQLKKSHDMGDKLKAFLFLSNNYVGDNNIASWGKLAREIALRIDACTVEQVQVFFHNLDKHPEEKNRKRDVAVNKLCMSNNAENKLAAFIYLSKTKHHDGASYSEKWLKLANEISAQVNDFEEEDQGKKLLIFLRKFNKHKKHISKDNDAAVTQVKTLVSKALVDEVTKVAPTTCAETFAQWKMTHAINGSFTFFNDWRSKRILKDATKTQKDEHVVDIVKRIKVARAA